MSAAPRGGVSRLLLVANRLPITIRVEEGKVRVSPSLGGLATGLSAVHGAGDGAWIGWPGEIPRLSEAQRSEVDRVLAIGRFIPLELSPTETVQFYEGFSNSVLWPLLHYQIERVPRDARYFAAFRDVNERYADLVAAHLRPGDHVWIHDYHLALLPALLRERVPAARIGFFLHTPFPSSEIFRVLPWRDPILRGMLGADLVGFHTFAYLRHFAASLLRCLGIEAEMDRVPFEGRQVRLGFFPMGIDARRIAEVAADPGVVADAAALRRRPDEIILLGVERLDYTKGLARRFVAVGRLLDQHPELRGRVRMIQIAAPSRSKVEAYARFVRELDEMVGRINGAHSTPESVPIHYVRRALDERELAVLYRAADVLVVTPLRDGMNLVVKEFIASRVAEDGVVVLSEFAGAAAELGETLCVNPYNIDETVEALARAIRMPAEERRARMRALRKRVFAHDVGQWTGSFLSALAEAADAVHAPPRKRGAEAAELVAAPGLIIFLDYDGTLVPLAPSPELAIPDEGLIDLLRRLGRAEGVQVHVVSGRKREDLDGWLGGLPLALHAEHGLWSREAAGEPWRAATTPDVRWKERIRPVFERVTETTPGSVLEEKTAGFAWHHRMAEPEFGAMQARELRLNLSDLLANAPVEVLVGDRVLEVRDHSAHKGSVVRRVLAGASRGALAIGIGDDRTDEDLFRAIPQDGAQFRVGDGSSSAGGRLRDWRAVRKFLEEIVAGRGKSRGAAR